MWGGTGSSPVLRWCSTSSARRRDSTAGNTWPGWEAQSYHWSLSRQPVKCYHWTKPRLTSILSLHWTCQLKYSSFLNAKCLRSRLIIFTHRGQPWDLAPPSQQFLHFVIIKNSLAGPLCEDTPIMILIWRSSPVARSSGSWSYWHHWQSPPSSSTPPSKTSRAAPWSRPSPPPRPPSPRSTSPPWYSAASTRSGNHCSL